MDIKQIKENKLKTLLAFAVPSIIAMLLQTVITVTDGYFTGNCVGEDALAAINLGLPVLYFYLGAGLCAGVGGSVICGRLLGARDKGKASEIFSQTLVTAAAVSAAASLLFAALFAPIRSVLGAGGPLSACFTVYYRVMLFCYPMMVLGTILGIFIRVDGKPQVCMLVNIGGCALNALLDYVLMARLGMGVRGGALASLAVQTLTTAAQLLYFLRASSALRFKRFRFDGAACRETLLNGSSEFIGEMASAISMFAFNYVLLKYVGVDGVAAFSVLGFAVYGFSMIVIGFGQGLTAPVSFLWGAGEKKAAAEMRQLTNKILFGVGVLFAALFWVFGRSYAELFGCGKGVVDMVSSGFRLFAAAFLIMGYDVINSMYFTGCGDASSSALISSLRGIVFLLAFTFLFPALWGMDGIWLVTPAAEALTAVVSFLLIEKQNREIEKAGDMLWRNDRALRSEAR